MQTFKEMLDERDKEIARLRAALRPFGEWDEQDESTHAILQDPAIWTAAKVALS